MRAAFRPADPASHRYRPIRDDQAPLRKRIRDLAASKNGEPRVIVLTDDLLALVQRRWAARQYETKTGTALST